MSNRGVSILACVLAVGAISAPAAGDAVRFGDWRSVSATDSTGGYVPTVESQLQITVSDQTPDGASLDGEVRFTFENLGPVASSVTDIFLQDGDLIGAADPIPTPGVSFVERDSGAVAFPGGELIGFDATRQFSRAAEPSDGIESGEQLTLYLKLLAGQTYEEVLDALQSGGSTYPNSMPPGGLRIGMHVQTPGGLDGASFVMVTVPLPNAAWAGIALFGFVGGWSVWRKSWRERALD